MKYLRTIFILMVSAWTVISMHELLNNPMWISTVLAASMLLFSLYGIKKIKYFWLTLGINLIYLIFFSLLSPEIQFRNTVWQKPWAKKPYITRFDNGKIKIHDMRNFKYRSEDDFDALYSDKIFDPDKIESLDIAVSHWDDLELISHTMLNFNFSDGQKLTVSVETRLPENKRQTFLSGLCKQHELIIVLGTPEDLFDLRSRYRGECLFVYRTTVSPQQAKELLGKIIDKVEQLHTRPEFYHVISANCTTALLPLFQSLNQEKNVFDIRFLLNGYVDKMLFEKGLLQKYPGEKFDSLKARSLIKGKCNGEL